MPNFGPLYCETGHALGFLAEPVNAFTSLGGLIAAAALLWYAHRRGMAPWYLYPLAALIALGSVGSFLWHGLREPWALSLDSSAGAAAILALAFLWAMELWNRWAGYALVAGIVGVLWLFFTGGVGDTLPFMVRVFLPLAAGMVLLAAATLHRSRRLGAVALLAFGLLIAALSFRTADFSACFAIPFGTHFLWQLLNAAAAFIAAVLILRLRALTKEAGGS